jgi:IclR family pca regulon transcriptional regulator
MRAKLTESVQRAFMILEAFSPDTPRIKLQQLSEKVYLPKVTIFRSIRTLEGLGYIHRDPASKTYNLTPRVMLLGYTALASIDLREFALPYLQELTRLTSQNVNLGIIDKTEVVYIECVKSRRRLHVPNYVGSRLNIYRTSIGLALLAFMPAADLAPIVEMISKTPDAREYLGAKGKLLWEKLRKVRTDGYAVNDEQFIPGSRGIAAPIFDGRGEIEAAINMPVFSSEVTLEDLLDEYLPLLLETARKISEGRGYRKNQQVAERINVPIGQ